MPELSIVIPAYNEESRLERGVGLVVDFVADRGLDAEILVVDDGSKDRTPELLAKLADTHTSVSAITLDHNRGKGAAVREGVRASKGRFVLFADVDQSTPMAEWERLRAELDRGFDVAIASREVAGAQRLRSRWHRRMMGNVFRILRDVFVVEGFIDSQCGFKLFTRGAADVVFARARMHRFCFDVELLAIAVHHKLRVIEVPVTWTDDHASKVSPLIDSLSMLRDLWRIRRHRIKGRYD